MATEGRWLLVPEVPLQGAPAAGKPCRSFFLWLVSIVHMHHIFFFLMCIFTYLAVLGLTCSM